jgi:5-methylcytosine-specific restriction endonuclease McrA
MQVTIDRSTYDKLERARALLSHAIPSRDVAQVLDRALDALIAQLEKRKLGATTKPRERRRPTRQDSRHIPAHVKRAVRARDGDRCTYIAESGRRCETRDRLEWDHSVPIALGGRSTVGNIRLRCRAHNQLHADRVFGPEFMRHKRNRGREGAGCSEGGGEGDARCPASRRSEAASATVAERPASHAQAAPQ